MFIQLDIYYYLLEIAIELTSNAQIKIFWKNNMY